VIEITKSPSTVKMADAVRDIGTTVIMTYWPGVTSRCAFHGGTIELGIGRFVIKRPPPAIAPRARSSISWSTINSRNYRKIGLSPRPSKAV